MTAGPNTEIRTNSKRNTLNSNPWWKIGGIKNGYRKMLNKPFNLPRFKKKGGFCFLGFLLCFSLFPAVKGEGFSSVRSGSITSVYGVYHLFNNTQETAF